MTFEELFGEALDHELGSADRSERFTLVRRKRAVNLAQREFARLTDCFQREAQVDLVHDISEYDLESVINDDAFMRFTDAQPWLNVSEIPGIVRTLTGNEFPRVDIPLLDREQPGWRGVGLSQPTSWYLREDGGRMLFGVVPTPRIVAPATWTALIPYSAYPADMLLNTDQPYSTTSSGGNSKLVLRVYHQALVHHAASTLEKLRRNYPQMNFQTQMFRDMVADYLARRQPTGGTRVSMARNYFREAQRQRIGLAADPRR
jgi:hypothetical protein